MREILFRGKGRESGTWKYGNLTRHNMLNYACSCVIGSGDFCDIGEVVIPETIGQYTGLNDRNGEKIFEGDIIECGENRYKAIVKYGEYSAVNLESFHHGFYLEWEVEYCYRRNDIGYWARQGIEVIGNVFDMPSLIGGTT